MTTAEIAAALAEIDPAWRSRRGLTRTIAYAEASGTKPPDVETAAEENVPTPEQIRAGCLEIQRAWSPRERKKRIADDRFRDTRAAFASMPDPTGDDAEKDRWRDLLFGGYGGDPYSRAMALNRERRRKRSDARA
jgi:hypothetical protein